MLRLKMQQAPNPRYFQEIPLQLQTWPKITEELITVLQQMLLDKELGEMWTLKVQYSKYYTN